MARDARAELVDLLVTLTPKQWDAPTLCSEWRVRDVVAHMVSYDELSTLGLVGRFLRSGLIPGGANALGVGAYTDRSPGTRPPTRWRCWESTRSAGAGPDGVRPNLPRHPHRPGNRRSPRSRLPRSRSCRTGKRPERGRWPTAGTSGSPTSAAGRGCSVRSRAAPPTTSPTGWPSTPRPGATGSGTWRSTCARCSSRRSAAPCRTRRSSSIRSHADLWVMPTSGR